MPVTAEDPKVARTGRNYNFWVKPELAQAFEEFIASIEYETKYKSHLEKALQEYLAKRGFWPPKG